jgi:WS/DGAT/MGAT family acyltransferase
MAKLGFYDYAFLLTETADSPKHVAGVQVFEPPADYPGDYVRDLMDALRERPPGGLFKLKLKPAVLGSPEWIDDESFDLEYHLRHARLPRPGSDQQLMDLVGRLHSVLLDRQRPLWELHVIEGLEGGRFALYAKIHHSYCDGITLVRLMMGTLNTSPDDTTLYASWESRHEAPLKKQARGLGKRLEKSVGLLRRGATTAVELSGLAARFAMQSLGMHKSKFPVPFTAPRTRLNTAVTRARRAAIGDMSMAQLKSVAKTTETTLNDVIVTICDIALTRYLKDHKDSPHTPLVAQIPVSLRREGDDHLGNQIAILPVTLGHAGRDPLKRLLEVHESSAQLKEEATALSPDSVSFYTLAIQGAAQFVEMLGVGDALPPLGNVLISNVPGPREPLYLWRARLVASYPLSAIPPGLAMNITVFSYDGKFDIGLIAGYDAVPDIELLPGYMADALGALEAALSRRASRSHGAKPARHSRRRKSKPKATRRATPDKASSGAAPASKSAQAKKTTGKAAKKKAAPKKSKAPARTARARPKSPGPARKKSTRKRAAAGADD